MSSGGLFGKVKESVLNDIIIEERSEHHRSEVFGLRAGKGQKKQIQSTFPAQRTIEREKKYECQSAPVGQVQVIDHTRK